MGLRNVYDYILLFWEVLLIYWNGAVTLFVQLTTPRRIPQDFILRKRQVAIVTGGNRGIGLEVVKQLMKLGMHVIIACRAPEDCEVTIKELSENQPDGKVEAMKLDVSSIDSVRQFADRFQAKQLPLHLLINNAGVMLAPYQKTVDGFEYQFGVNYLGHFLLTLLLLPRLKEAGTSSLYSRIVNISSCVAFAGKIKFESFRNVEIYSSQVSYSQAKLAQIMFTVSLQEKLTEEGAFVTVSCLHPGVIFSDLFTNVCLYRVVSPVMKRIFQTPSYGARSIMYAASSPETEGIGGQYYLNCKAEKLPTIIHNKELLQRLWETSEELVGGITQN